MDDTHGPGVRLALVLVLALVVGLSACGSSSDDSGAPAPPTSAECGLDAFRSAAKPVDITFWHAMTRANAEWLEATTKQFNASQGDVRVKLVQFPNYPDLLTKYLAGLGTGDLPDVFHPEDTTVQRLIDSQSVVPVQACIDADGYSLETFLPRGTAYFTSAGTLYGMPWALSNPILWYDRTVFEKAGLDPDRPPTTFDEIRAYSEKIVASKASKHGIALRVEPYIF
jgi:sn-glycerol 3-phosphate transport system substrate-binding protein